MLQFFSIAHTHRSIDNYRHKTQHTGVQTHTDAPVWTHTHTHTLSQIQIQIQNKLYWHDCKYNIIYNVITNIDKEEN